MGESVQHYWKLYRGKKAANEVRERKAKTRIKDLPTLNTEIDQVD